MFDIGFWELAVIGIVALLVVGPERLPGMIKTTGQWAGRIQRLARELRTEIEREAVTPEFRKLNQEFLAEDRRLKELARSPSSPLAQSGAAAAPQAAGTPAENVADKV
jgi:sec-independent protein translocase protein TatB